MGSNNHANKARKQLHTGGGADAHWFSKRVARGRKRNKIAEASRKRNRSKK